MGIKSLGVSPLMEAIRANSLHRVIDALENGADVEEKDIHGFAGLPLRTACFVGNVPIIRELLNNGADVNAPTGDGPGAPLRAALRGGHNEIAALLLAHDAQIPFGLDIPLSVYERSKALATGTEEVLDMPVLEFDRHDIPVPPRVEKPAIAATQKEAVLDENVLEFSSERPTDRIEEVDMRGVYGVDTRVLTLDFERSTGAWEKVEPLNEPLKLDDLPEKDSKP